MKETENKLVLDCRGMHCPLPIYKASMAMNEVRPGQLLEVWCTDPGARADFPAFAKQGGHELVEVRREEGYEAFVIRKGGSQ